MLAAATVGAGVMRYRKPRESPHISRANEATSCHRAAALALATSFLGADISAQGKLPVCSRPVRLMAVHFFGFRGACARSDAIGPRSRFGVLGLRKSLPACDASRFDVVMLLFPFSGFASWLGHSQPLFYAFYSPRQIHHFR